MVEIKITDQEILNCMNQGMSNNWIHINLKVGMDRIKKLRSKITPLNDVKGEANINMKLSSDIKTDISIMIDLFYKAIEIPDFLKIISENESKAISRLEMLK